MIHVAHLIQINENELRFEFIRASGPGGQNVNKVATAVQLRFNVRNSSLPETTKERLTKIAAKRLSSNGDLIIEAKQFRSQEKNRQDAIDRLIALIQKASKEPKLRRKTKPTKASKEKRLSEKKRMGEIKKTRQKKHFE